MKDYSFPISFTEAKSGHKIPIVNGVYLHSVYDPIKEAEALLQQNEKNLVNENKVLILGLGYGYHVNEIRSKLTLNHGADYTIYVVEPNPDAVKTVKDQNALLEGNIKIICKKTLDDFFSDTDFVNFLMKKPRIISHSASFNLYSEFFKDFMSFERHDSLSTNMNIIRNSKLKNMFIDEEEDSSFSTAIEKLTHRSGKDSKDSFLLNIYKILQN